MQVNTIIDWFGYAVYVTLAALAMWGIYNTVMLYRTLRKKSIGTAHAQALLNQERDLLQKGDAKAAVAATQVAPYWHTALAQLIGVAIAHRDKGLAKVKQMLVMEFHTEIISGMENRLASISTIVRMGPLLGLLGTVASMIGAFGRIGGSEKVDPNALAADISLALWATGSGLLIATPMMIAGNDIHAKLRRLRDRTERQLGDFIEILEKLEPAARTRPGSSRAVLR
ncbi:MAG: MotA/TolQ/ExbB proton channel family protein [Isosphaeraceae bacterium]